MAIEKFKIRKPKNIENEKLKEENTLLKENLSKMDDKLTAILAKLNE